MDKQVMRQLVNNLVLPNASDIKPYELIKKYDNLLELFNVSSSTDLALLLETVNEIYTAESERFMLEDEDIFRSIMKGSGSDKQAQYYENEERKKQLMLRLLPFMYFLKRKAAVRSTWENSYHQLRQNNTLRSICDIIRKYYIKDTCSSLLMTSNNGRLVNMIYADTSDLLLMIASTIKGYLENMNIPEISEPIDDLLLRLAELCRDRKYDPEGRNEIHIYQKDTEQAPSKRLISFIDNATEEDFKIIEQSINDLEENSVAHFICIYSGKNCRTMIGGSNEEIEALIADSINFLIAKGDKNLNSFNKVAAQIKALSRQLYTKKKPVLEMEKEIADEYYH